MFQEPSLLPKNIFGMKRRSEKEWDNEAIAYQPIVADPAVDQHHRRNSIVDIRSGTVNPFSRIIATYHFF
jgi:hypothetical protein